MTLTSPNILASYLYRHLGEQMPPELPDDATPKEIEEQNSWFLQPDPFFVNEDDLVNFIREVEILLERIEELPEDSSEEEYQTLFYDAAKAAHSGDKTKIRGFFMWLYLVLYGQQHGFRWGPMVTITGPRVFTENVRERFQHLV